MLRNILPILRTNETQSVYLPTPSQFEILQTLAASITLAPPFFPGNPKFSGPFFSRNVLAK